MPINSIRIEKLTPVVYCGGQVVGQDEYDAPSGAEAHYILDVGNPPGTQVIGAWYQPYDNIQALSCFQTIDVTRHDDSHVTLIVRSYPRVGGRMRLLISVLCQS